MKITLSREEVQDLVREKYSIKGDFLLEISSERATRVTENTLISTVNSNNQVLEIKEHNPYEVNPKNNVKESEDEEDDDEECDASPVSVIPGEFIRPIVKVKKVESKKKKTDNKKYRGNQYSPDPTKTKNDYQKYGIVIEEFLNSIGNTMSIDLENLTVSGMEYRYRIAAKMFGYYDRVKFSKSKAHNELLMSKR